VCWQAAFNARVSHIEKSPIDVVVSRDLASRPAAKSLPSRGSRSSARTRWLGIGGRRM